MTAEEIDRWVNLRKEMREAKHYIEADSIRNELKRLGVILEDRRDGRTQWRYE